MLRLTSLVALTLIVLGACTAEPTSEPTSGTSDVSLAQSEDLPGALGKGDSAWDTTATLHVGERTVGHASAAGRQVFPVWLDGRAEAPLSIDIVAKAMNEDSVRVAVLGPLVNGTREVLGAAGYSAPRANIELTVDATSAGEYLVVVGSFGLATETSFQVAAHCGDCDAARTDVLASPKSGALVVNDARLVQLQLGSVLADRPGDIVVEMWASPPARPWLATQVTTTVAAGTQATALVPASVADGDDLRFVVREAGGAVLDAGVTTRFVTSEAMLVRTDALLYGDIASIGASGVAGFYEGHAELSLRSEPRHVEIAAADVRADRPGQVGNGFGAFDATFLPALELGNGELNPNLPLNGEILSIGMMNGNGEYRRLGCFEYCNDLSGMATCTGGPRSCPVTAW